jgi:hypothetical protein
MRGKNERDGGVKVSPLNRPENGDQHNKHSAGGERVAQQRERHLGKSAGRIECRSCFHKSRIAERNAEVNL